ncbi:MAG TPA: hypothetical protein VFL55_21710 [Acetobacteraceae bacterium]|nr:hypothetical protein [Acetobacteraceae bacterium]
MRGHDPQAVAHFVNRLVLCMLAADVGLLPAGLGGTGRSYLRATTAGFPAQTCEAIHS